MTKKPDYEVFGISQYGQGRKTQIILAANWRGIQNRDGSINLLLRALPMPDANSGAALLQLRPPRPDSEAIREDEAAFYLEIDPIMGAPIEEL